MPALDSATLTGAALVPVVQAGVNGVTTVSSLSVVLGASAVPLYAITGGEAGVVDTKYPVGNVLRYGADPTFTIDSTAAIAAAIAATATSKADIIVPAGTYMATPINSVVDETATAAKACFIMRSDMHIVLDPGATIKIKNNVSSAAAPVQMRMFFSNQVLARISFVGGTLDMNGANNALPAYGVTGNRYNQAHIMFSGTGAAVGLAPGIAATASDVMIDGVTFLNTPGTTCIGMQQSNTVSVPMGARWTVTNCTFRNNGFTTDDHSSIFGWADDFLCEGNTFVGVATAAHQVGTALEVHGSNARVVKNTITTHMMAAWIACNLSTPVDGTVFQGNVCTDLLGLGLEFYREGVTNQPVTNTLIDGNIFSFNDLAYLGDIKVAVQIAASYQIKGLTVSNNKVIKTGTTVASALGNINGAALVAGQVHDHIIFDGNSTTGTTFGVLCSTSAVGNLGSITVENNKMLDLTPSTLFLFAMGVSYSSAAGTIKSLTIKGNTIAETRAVALAQYGVFLENGTVTQLNVRANDHVRLVTANYHESALSVGTRIGEFAGAVYTPTWAGITLGNGIVGGNSTPQSGGGTLARARIVIGSTTAFPGGNISVNLPSASTLSGELYLGTWIIKDSSAGTYFTGVCLVDGTASTVQLLLNNGQVVTAISPVTLATGDSIGIQIVYA